MIQRYNKIANFLTFWQIYLVDLKFLYIFAGEIKTKVNNKTLKNCCLLR